MPITNIMGLSYTFSQQDINSNYDLGFGVIDEVDTVGNSYLDVYNISGIW